MGVCEVGLAVLPIIALGLVAWAKEWISLRSVLVLAGTTVALASFRALNAHGDWLTNDGRELGALIVVVGVVIVAPLFMLFGPPRAYTARMMKRLRRAA